MRYRALLDSGSQISCITRKLVNKLGCRMVNTNMPVSGIENVKSPVNKFCAVIVKSMCRNFTVGLRCLVYDELTRTLSASYFSIDNLKIPSDLDIDLLNGMDRLPFIVKSGFVKFSNELPVVMDIELRWMIGGFIDSSDNGEGVHTNIAVSDNLD